MLLGQVIGGKWFGGHGRTVPADRGMGEDGAGRSVDRCVQICSPTASTVAVHVLAGATTTHSSPTV